MQSFSKIMNPEKMGKKVKKAKAPVVVKEPEPINKWLISDTTCLGLGKSSWESIYNLIEVEEPEEMEEEATADSNNESKGTLKELAYSYLHRIAARAKVLPYTDVVRWVVEKIPTIDRTFSKVDGKIFGSFKPKDPRQMYHLPQQEKRYNKAFLEAF